MKDIAHIWQEESHLKREPRLALAKKHLKDLATNFQKALFQNQNFTMNVWYVWRKLKTAHNRNIIILTVKHGDGSIMLQGCETGEGVRTEGRMNGAKQRKIWEKNLTVCRKSEKGSDTNIWTGKWPKAQGQSYSGGACKEEGDCPRKSWPKSNWDPLECPACASAKTNLVLPLLMHLQRGGGRGEIPKSRDSSFVKIYPKRLAAVFAADTGGL